MNQLINFGNLTSTELNAAVVLFNLIFSLLLQLAIIFVYRKTRHGLSYSKSFVFTLVMIGVLGTSIMMIVESNIIGAFALLGAFSLIRFRTILKETADVAYVFFSLAVGVAVGTNHYSIALITTIFVSIAIFLLQKYAFGTVSDNFDYILMLRAEKNFNPEIIKPILDKHLMSREILNVKNLGDSFTEIVYSLKLKSVNDSITLIDDLKKNSLISQVELLSGKSSSEY